ncbi:MAG: M50 family metallopeptidase [Endomicrobia bacterium]|nr:M50 family metallopeptidase [Endomicrobiia bacterium]
MILIQILAILVGLGFLIFIHELGHFLSAKFFKVRVLTFAFGFGPDLIKYVYKGTKYCIKAIPFGGFVAMAGENPDEAKGEKDEYLSLPWYKKVWIAFSGPFFNYILAVFIFAFIFNIWGVSKISDASAVGTLAENYPAMQAGLMPGDVIKSIDGVNITKWTEMSDILKHKAEQDTAFVIERGTYTFAVNMVVAKNQVTGLGMIGITPAVITSKTTFAKSFIYGADAAITQTIMTIAYLGDKIISGEKPDIAGPVGVMQVIAKAAKAGIQDYLRLLAVISVALGLFNLFPIPMVDGGMIVLFIVEGITRKKIGTKVIQIYNTIGLVLIIAIFLFATYSDLMRLGLGKLFGK